MNWFWESSIEVLLYEKNFITFPCFDETPLIVERLILSLLRFCEDKIPPFSPAEDPKNLQSVKST
jgi:hypothetical protein